MKQLLMLLVCLIFAASLTACGKADGDKPDHGEPPGDEQGTEQPDDHEDGGIWTPPAKLLFNDGHAPVIAGAC